MDIPLSDEGLKQADLLGKYLRNDIFTGIYASDLKRAYQVGEFNRRVWWYPEIGRQYGRAIDIYLNPML